MFNKLIQQQLDKVQVADLSCFDPATVTYYIKRRTDIKIEEHNCYQIHLKPSCFDLKSGVNVNWNRGNTPPGSYIQVDINKRVSKMVQVAGVCFQDENLSINARFWSGWLSIDDIEVMRKL